MGSRVTPRDVEGRRQNRTLSRKNLCDMARTECERATKTMENGRSNPIRGKWAFRVTYDSDLGWGGDRSWIGA